jgi:hypothetical protein
MAYYDEETNTTYFDGHMVLNITEFDSATKKRDSDIFILYDRDDELFYVYGARGSNQKYVRYQHTFVDVKDLHNFISLVVSSNPMSVSVNYLEGLASDDNYDTFFAKASRYNEVVAYDNVESLTRKALQKYVDVIM